VFKRYSPTVMTLVYHRLINVMYVLVASSCAEMSERTSTSY